MTEQKLLRNYRKVVQYDEEFTVLPTANEKYNDFLFSLYDRGFEKQAHNMSRCGQSKIYMNARSNIKLPNGRFQSFNKDFIKTCKDRFCPYCSTKRSQKQQMSLKKHFKNLKKDFDVKNLRMVTLTFKSVTNEEDLQEVYSHVSKDIVKFRKTLQKMGYHILSGYRVLETTFKPKGTPLVDLKSGIAYATAETDMYHPHVHLLYFSNVERTEKTNKYFSFFTKKFNPAVKDKGLVTYNKVFKSSDGYIDYEFLKSLWAVCSHDQAHVSNPQRIRLGINGGINYVTKYLTKDLFSEGSNADMLVNYYSASKKYRLIQKFGELFDGYSTSISKVKVYHISDVNNEFPFKFGLDIEGHFCEDDEIKFIECETT